MLAAALCRVCLRAAPDVRLVRSSTARVFFTDVVRLMDVPESVILCLWCDVSVRRAIELCQNAVHADPLLRWIHSALLGGHVINENLISNARSLQKVLHPLNYKQFESIEIAESDLSANPAAEQNIEDTEYNEVKREGVSSDKDDYPLMHTKLLKRVGIQVETTAGKENIENNVVPKNAKFESINLNVKRKKQRDAERIEYKKRNVHTLTKKKKRKEKDNSHFDIIYLSFEEQLQTIEDNKRTEKYKKSKYNCDFCGLGFLMENVHKRHMDRHEASFGCFKCDVCTLRFKTNEVLLQHSLAHRRHFRCVQCGALVRRRCHCAAHRAKCVGSGPPVVCEYCSKMFRDIYTLKQHMSGVHLKDKSFICDFCSKSFAHKQKLLVHLRCHTGERPFQCDTCNKTFSTNSNLKVHTATHDGDRARHYCVECDAYFRTAKGLKRHFEESAKHLDRDSLNYMCSQCPMRFLNEKRLVAHVNFVHLGRSDNRCNICGKPFGSSGNLRKHVQTVHDKVTKPKDKICDVCGRGFALKRTLESHMHTHTGARPHACDMCSATFTQQSAKNTHTRAVHLDIKRQRPSAARCPKP